jgi:hypothetical protein
MDDATKNIELLDKFMANERKSKLWTTVNIGIFCLLGLSIFFLAYQLNKSNAKYKIINEQLKKTQDSLKIALGQLDHYNVSLKQDSISLTNRVGNYDSLKSVLDTVLILLKETKSGGEKNTKVSENIKNIITAEKPAASGNTVYTVFLQCMPGFEKMMPGMVKDLKERKYKVPKWEIVKDITFDPVIKYFYQADAEEAKKIAALINKSNDFFQKNPVKVQKLNLKSQQRQIEVWIGEYRRKDIQQLIQQSAPEQKKS